MQLKNLHEAIAFVQNSRSSGKMYKLRTLMIVTTSETKGTVEATREPLHFGESQRKEERNEEKITMEFHEEHVRENHILPAE